MMVQYNSRPCVARTSIGPRAFLRGVSRCQLRTERLNHHGDRSLLREVQGEEGNEGSRREHDEERQAHHEGQVSRLRNHDLPHWCQQVSTASRCTKKADSLKSRPSAFGGHRLSSLHGAREPRRSSKKPIATTPCCCSRSAWKRKASRHPLTPALLGRPPPWGSRGCRPAVRRCSAAAGDWGGARCA